MSRFALLLFVVPLILPAAEWVQFRSGPFEVLSNAGEKKGRETLNFLEQLRHALGWQLGNTDLPTTWPVRVLVLKNREEPQPVPKPGRQAYMASITDITPEFAAGVVQVLLDSWPGLLPPNIERGLVQVYSTLQVDGTRVRLGTPVAQKDRDWTRAHMLAVHPDYSGKLRVLLGNLSKGVERDVAYRNSFAMTPEQIEAAVDRYMIAGEYGTIAAPSKPLNARRELVGKDVEDTLGRIAQADLLLAQGEPGAPAAYEALLSADPESVEAHEGLGLTANDGAHLKHAKSARALVAWAKLQSDPATKRDALTKAAAANPRWAEPHRMLAELEPHPAQKLAAWRKAAELQPRVADYWIALAELQEESSQFADAAKSWAAAERTTDDPNERERIRQRRIAGERKRVEAQIAAREEAKRKAEEEMQALRNKALLEIRAAEARANAGKPVIDPRTLEEYREGPNTKKISGTLVRVDCRGKQARMHVRTGKQTVLLLVPDPGQVALAGGGQLSLTCGPQKRGRAVNIDYYPRTDDGQGTSGDVRMVEFR